MTALRIAVRTVGELCVTAGALVLLFVVWQLWWTDVGAGRDQRATTERLLRAWDDEQVEAGGPAELAPADPASPAAPELPLDALPAVAVPEVGEPFAVLRVPRFGEDYARPLLEGTSLDVLEDGVGHYPGTAMPGEVGNFAVAGHRTTYARPLHRIAELQPGDPVVVETADAVLTYRVRDASVVRPQDVEVIAPVPDQPGAAPVERLMTLTSCHPMYSARERYVVHAVLERAEPRAGAAVEG